jgi:LacI family transcriptional regulator
MSEPRRSEPRRPADSGKVTIYEVAARAGVSPSTVSHVINRTRRVEGPTRSRVQEAISALGYERNALANALASGLRGRRTRTLGLMLPDLSNATTVEVARGVEAIAGDAGYGLFLCNTDDQPKRQRAYIRMLLEHQVAGIIVNPVRGTTEDIARLQARGIPLVALGHNASTLPVDAVRLDYATGARQAVEHLVARGHRRIASLPSRRERLHPVVVARRRGYEAALRAAGIEPDPALELLCENTVDDGREVVSAALEPGRAPFTAVIAFMPLAALGTLMALRGKRLRVPDDVSVIAFGDFEWMRAHAPPLTTVDQPTYEVGREAAGLVLRRIDEAQRAAAGPDTEPAARGGPDGRRAAGAPPTVVNVATNLIVRESVRGVRA